MSAPTTSCSCLGARPTVDGSSALKGLVSGPCACSCSQFACDCLKVVVLEFPPWVLDAPTVVTTAVNCPPGPYVGRGMVARAALSAPTGWLTPDIPDYITSGWPQASCRRAVEYNFGGGGGSMCCGSQAGTATGTLRACTAGSCSVAALKFQYTWSVGADGRTVTSFTPLEMYHNGIAFVVLDAQNYLAGTACEKSIVVLALQQDCTPCGYDLKFLPAGGCVAPPCPGEPGTGEGDVVTRSLDARTGQWNYASFHVTG